MRLEEMIRKCVILPDVHLDSDKIPRPYGVAKQYIKETGADDIVLLGDFLDMSAISHWNETNLKSREGKRVTKEMERANLELDFLQQHSQQVYYIFGNHEAWVDRYVEKNPELEGLLDLRALLNLKGRKIPVTDNNKFLKIGKMNFTHGLYTNKYHATKHVQTVGANVCYGHQHGFQVDTMVMHMQLPHAGYGLGCLCENNPEYLKGRPNNWTNQFGIMYYDTKSGQYNLNPVTIVNGKCIVDGKVYDGNERKKARRRKA
jgi:predicted phosphodiesterase